MGCRNPKSEFSAENCETLETLGPKIQNSRNCNLRVVGGALREAVHPYAIFSPNVSILSVGTPKKRGSYGFLETLGGSYGSAEERGRLVARSLCNGFFKTYALIPC
jgi:hypothetical protein